MQALKNYWYSKNAEQRRWLFIGGVILSLLLTYWLVWQPLFEQVQLRRQIVLQQQKLMDSLQQTAAEMSTLQKSVTTKTALQSADFLTVLKTNLTTYQLSSVVSDIKASNNGVTFSFKSADFDQLLTFMITLTQHYTVSVKEITLVNTTNPGMVDGSLSLTF